MSNLSEKDLVKDMTTAVQGCDVEGLRLLLMEHMDDTIYMMMHPNTIHRSTTPTNNSIENLTWVDKK